MKSILVANWKNKPHSLSLAENILKSLARNAKIYKKLSLFIAPPFTYMESLYRRKGGFVRLASQDIPNVFSGIYTGEISVDILKSFRVELSIIGHSERRALGETNEVVREKIKVALRSGITPLVCVGEVTRDEDGEHFEFLREQIKSSLGDIKKNDLLRIAIAYEPVWAIGKESEDALKPEDLSEAVLFIRRVLSDIFGRSAAEKE